MSQTPHPHDPFAAEPGGPDAPQSEQGAPTSDPSLHPHDPYAYDADAAGSDPLDIESSPEPAPHPQQQPSTDPYAAPQSPYAAPQDQYTAPQGQYTAPQSPYVPPQDQYAAPAAGSQAGPLTGLALNASDSRMWAMFSQLSAVLGQMISWGVLGWVGPLIIYVIYKDRDRLVRHHAAEALNGAIVAAAVWLLYGLVSIVTFGIGAVLFPLALVPVLVHVVFAIIGAVKANQGEYWKYPLNMRLVK